MVAISKYRKFRSENSVRAFIKRREFQKYTFSTANSKKITDKIQATRKYKLKKALGYAAFNFHCTRGGLVVQKIKGAERQRNRT